MVGIFPLYKVKESREDIFMRRNSMPTQSGIPAEKLPYANYGKMENHGVEFTLSRSSYFAKCFRTRFGVLPKDYT